MIALRAPWVAAAALSTVVLPLAVLGLGLPLWAGVLAAAGTLVAGGAFARRRASVTHARPAPAHATVVEDAETAHTALVEAAREVADAAVRARLKSIAASTRTLIDRVTGDPALLGSLQRALAYYVPRAGALATAYAVMEDVGERERLPEVARVLARLDAWLARSLDITDADARRALDVELKLIDDALDEDAR